MARKRTSLTAPATSKKKQEAPPAPLPAPTRSKPRKSYMQRWRESREGGTDSEKWARLELELGRFAQGASLVSGFFLVLSAFMASLLSTQSGTLLFPVFGTDRQDMILWLPLLLAGFMISGFTFAKKLEPYRAGYRSAHFISSVVAFAVSILFLTLALLDHFAVVDLGNGLLLGFMFPGSVLGLSLAFVSLGLTWEGLGWRKASSIVASMAVPFSLVAFMFNFPSAPRGYQLLLLVYMYDALAIGFAGSMLHLIASGVEASQREILKASDTKIGQLKSEMTNKIQALEYKEAAYVEREAHLEAKEKDLLDIETELDARSKELNAVQAKLDAQGKELTGLESRMAKMRAEVEAKVEEFGLKDRELQAARLQLQESRQSLAQREATIGEREKELKRNQIDITSRERAVQAKAAEVSDQEARLRKDDSKIDSKRNEMIRRQKELELKESEVKLKIEQLEAQQSTEMKGKIAQLKDWEEKVLAKERALGQLEVQVRQAQEEMKQNAANADAYADSLASERERLAAREQELNAHEKKISDLDSGIEEKSAEIDRRWQEVIEAQKRVNAKETEYNTLFKDAKLREANVSTTKEEVSRRQETLETREAKLKDWQANLGQETKKFQDKYREILAREKALEAKESDLSLKELEVTTREREAVRAPAAAPPAGTDVDREGYMEHWENRLKEREEEFKRRMYQKEKELEAREMAVKEQLKAAATTASGESLEAPVEVSVDRGDRLKTGTARLDDLLYGGLPMNANVLFVGPAFVGKEVVILNFIAEGLKGNVPAILLTTSKPPVEIAKEMAPVLPTFMEYEQLGLVRWIDASGTTPTQKPTRDGNTYRVPNAADFNGILQAVDAFEEEFRERASPYFRFAFLTLSSSLTQADDKTALGFVQRFVNRLRQSKSVSAFALERGMHTDQQVESLQQLMDGALHFKQDKSKTLMSVVGIGEVQTRDWVPYKFTNKALMIGSFQLERIR